MCSFIHHLTSKQWFPQMQNTNHSLMPLLTTTCHITTGFWVPVWCRWACVTEKPELCNPFFAWCLATLGPYTYLKNVMLKQLEENVTLVVSHMWISSLEACESLGSSVGSIHPHAWGTALKSRGTFSAIISMFLVANSICSYSFCLQECTLILLHGFQAMCHQPLQRGSSGTENCCSGKQRCWEAL